MMKTKKIPMPDDKFTRALEKAKAAVKTLSDLGFAYRLVEGGKKRLEQRSSQPVGSSRRTHGHGV